MRDRAFASKTPKTLNFTHLTIAMATTSCLQSLRLRARAACSKRFLSSNRTIQEHESIFVTQSVHKNKKWSLTKPLRHGDSVKVGYGARIAASEIIGKRFLDVVKDSAGRDVMLQEPTLSGYITNSERLATPIYPHDCNTMVSLMDINLSRPGEDGALDDTEPFEIFEAGTGMGSLTMHISRAIHAANPALPPSLREALCATSRTRRSSTLLQPDLEPEQAVEFENYRRQRRAILHTIDRKTSHSNNAYKVVRNFSRALYLANIDFHQGSISEFIEARMEQNGGKPFLSRAILDLPSAEQFAEPVVRALHRNATILLFCPSISQVAEFDNWRRTTGMRMTILRVIELPNSTFSGGEFDGSGGKEWSVGTSLVENEDGSTKVVQRMRPKVGDRIAGGGFVAVFRRMQDMDVDADSEASTASDQDATSVDAGSEVEVLEDTPETPDSVENKTQ
ncbi:S-adenosyl-L-methionine-dependent methyltransferase [Stachybotrys elegans]|uniref:tRNA (adenine(58)-N(1))-methyltransferase catalytic subunit TRM61 n=1 Tax=Stachybotrys elegans TaxID=80388 RepID=A0A8K0WLX4_9HYPO|nr:S-adenosyl-L-methionine-dependent methyltransferase [Stachybotrys elegans]